LEALPSLGLVIGTRGVSYFISKPHPFLTRTFQVPLENLISLLDDIFGTEDSLPPDVSDTVDLSKIASLRDMTNVTFGGGELDTPMTEIKTQLLLGLLKMLERSVKAGADPDPFATTAYQGGGGTLSGSQEGTASPRKKKTASKKGTKSQTHMRKGSREDVVIADANENQD
jgi:hypothetical protein